MERSLFSSCERDILLELIEKYKHIIECRKNDTDSIVNKRKTWERITEEFNNNKGVKLRSARQVKKLWFNYKQATKKQCHKIALENNKTNSSPAIVSISKAFPATPNQMINSEQCEEDVKSFKHSNNMVIENIEADRSSSSPTNVISISKIFTEKSNKNFSSEQCYEDAELLGIKRVTPEDFLKNEMAEHKLRMKLLRHELRMKTLKRRQMEVKFNAEMQYAKELHELKVELMLEEHKKKLEKL